MYAFYLATIILAPLFVFFILLYVLPNKLTSFYDNKLVYKSDGRPCHFYNDKWQLEELKDQPKVLEKLKKNYAKKKRWHTIYLWDDESKIGLMFIVGRFFSLPCLFPLLLPCLLLWKLPDGKSSCRWPKPLSPMEAIWRTSPLLATSSTITLGSPKPEPHLKLSDVGPAITQIATLSPRCRISASKYERT